jgi:hypothetical protein
LLRGFFIIGGTNSKATLCCASPPGFPEGHIPGAASFYDFINRIVKLDDRPRVKAKTKQPVDRKLDKGKKLPPETSEHRRGNR